MRSFMSPGAASFGADAFADSKAALAAARSATCVSFRTSPTNAWPPRSNVPSLNGTGAPPDWASVSALQAADARANPSVPRKMWKMRVLVITSPPVLVRRSLGAVIQERGNAVVDEAVVDRVAAAPRRVSPQRRNRRQRDALDELGLVAKVASREI